MKAFDRLIFHGSRAIRYWLESRILQRFCSNCGKLAACKKYKKGDKNYCGEWNK